MRNCHTRVKPTPIFSVFHVHVSSNYFYAHLCSNLTATLALLHILNNVRRRPQSNSNWCLHGNFSYSEYVGMLVLKACCTCAHNQCPWLRQVRSSDEEEAAPLYRKKLNLLLTRWTEVVLFTIAKGQTAQSHWALPLPESLAEWAVARKKKKDFLVKK